MRQARPPGGRFRPREVHRGRRDRQLRRRVHPPLEGRKDRGGGGGREAEAPSLRRSSKSDSRNAETARAVLAGETAGEPEGGDGRVEIRASRAVRRSAVKARTQDANQLRALLFTALKTRAELRGFRPTSCPLGYRCTFCLDKEPTNGVLNTIASTGSRRNGTSRACLAPKKARVNRSIRHV